MSCRDASSSAQTSLTSRAECRCYTFEVSWTQFVGLWHSRGRGRGDFSSFWTRKRDSKSALARRVPSWLRCSLAALVDMDYERRRNLRPWRSSKLSVSASKQVTPHQVKARVKESRESRLMGETLRIGFNPARLDSTRLAWAGLNLALRRLAKHSNRARPVSPGRRAAHPTGGSPNCVPVPERHPACDGRKPTLQPSLWPDSVLIRRCYMLPLIPCLLRSSCTCTYRSSAPLVSVQSSHILRHHPPCHPAPPSSINCST